MAMMLMITATTTRVAMKERKRGIKYGDSASGIDVSRRQVGVLIGMTVTVSGSLLP